MGMWQGVNHPPSHPKGVQKYLGLNFSVSAVSIQQSITIRGRRSPLAYSEWTPWSPMRCRKQNGPSRGKVQLLATKMLRSWRNSWSLLFIFNFLGAASTTVQICLINTRRARIKWWRKSEFRSTTGVIHHLWNSIVKLIYWYTNCSKCRCFLLIYCMVWVAHDMQ